MELANIVRPCHKAELAARTWQDLTQGINQMTYSVTLAGTYRPGFDPEAVNVALAQLFKHDPATMAQLVRSGATIKRGVELPTAERFRAAIEQAGAACRVEDESAALTIDLPDEVRTADASRRADASINDTRTNGPASSQSAQTDEESTLLDIGPSLMAYLGPLILGTVLLAAFGLGLLVYLAVWITWKSTHYKLTDQRLFVRKGFISRRLEEIQLYRVKDVAFRQGVLERILGIGSIVVLSADSSAPEVVLSGVKSPEEVKETIRTAYRAARRKEGVRTGERMLD